MRKFKKFCGFFGGFFLAFQSLLSIQGADIQTLRIRLSNHHPPPPMLFEQCGNGEYRRPGSAQ